MCSSIAKPKKTILQVIPSLFSGGVERGTIEVAQGLQKFGYNPIIMSAGGPLVTKLTQSEIQHINLNVISKNPFNIWNNISLIADIIKQYNVDLVHARSRVPAWSSCMATKSTHTPFVTTFHGIYNISNFLKRYYNSIMIRGDIVIAVSDFVKQHIIKNYNADERKIRVIYRGVNHNYFDPENIGLKDLIRFKELYNVPNGTPVLLLPARFTAWKGHIQLVKALNLIKDLNFYCLMIGDLSKHPNFTKKVQEMIAEFKLQRKVRIYGNEQDIRALYALSDIVLSTSIEPEAFGRTIIEGQAMGKIVIATSIGGTVETIKNEVNGYHVRPHDINDLAEKIKYCLSIIGSEKDLSMRKVARESVINQFSAQTMLSKTIDVYNELV